MATDTVPKTENFNLANGEEDVICPSCDAKIKRSQVADHCQIEMERLHNMQLRSTQSAHATAVAAAPATTTTQTEPAAPEVGGQRRPWSVFQRVQRNRQTRQRQRTRKRPTPPPAAPTSASAPASSSASASTAAANSSSSCPVCNKSFAQPEIQEHVNQCLRASQRSNGERHSSDDDEDSDEYEEYEWAGQKRIRVSSLVQGGYAALNLGQTIKYNGSQQQQVGNEDEDDVNVDEDDTHIYGPTQYGEEDVIPLADDDDTATPSGGVSEAEVTSYVRRLISSNETPKSNSNPPAKHSSETTEQMDDTAVSLAPSTSGHQSATAPSTSRSSNNCSSASAMQQQQQIIESLKARLRLYEKQAQSKLKCLICIDDYKNPAISVSCWHVHCEQCWLQTLGARKLCPQCNSITTPKDLRRIYL